MIKFEVGKEVLVFVNAKEPDGIYGDNYYVAGLELGKYDLFEGYAANEKSDRDMSEASLISKIQQAKLENKYG